MVGFLWHCNYFYVLHQKIYEYVINLTAFAHINFARYLTVLTLDSVVKTWRKSNWRIYHFGEYYLYSQWHNLNIIYHQNKWELIRNFNIFTHTNIFIFFFFLSWFNIIISNVNTTNQVKNSKICKIWIWLKILLFFYCVGKLHLRGKMIFYHHGSVCAIVVLLLALISNFIIGSEGQQQDVKLVING